MQLSSRRCPHTGVVNFYADEEPHLAVGSIAKCGTTAETAGFAWRCHTMSSSASGRAPDLKTAERRLVNFFALTDRSTTKGTKAN